MVQMKLSERLRRPISTAELERRWQAVRGEMDSRGIDVLLLETHNDFYGGHIRYISDIASTRGKATALIFPRDRPMTAILHGNMDGDRRLPEGGDGVLRGVERVLTMPAFAGVHYTAAWEGERAAEALAPYADATVGLVRGRLMPAETVRLVTEALPRATFVDATGVIDTAKAVKSDEEVALVREAASIQDRALAHLVEVIEPGKTDYEVALAARTVSEELGSEQGFVLCSSAPPGAPGGEEDTQMQGRVVQKGDIFTVVIENSGPGGLWTELGRTIVLGEAPEQVLEDHRFVLAARKYCLDLLRPGARPPEIWERYNDYLREHGRPEEQRVHCHSQGYDIVERPLVRFDETMPIESGMTLACHPTYTSEVALASISDGFVIGVNGPQRMHQSAETVFEV
jgi:Xaa-Pro aminopeptidase